DADGRVLVRTTSNTPVVGSDLRQALPFRGTLTGTVAAGGRLTLTAGGSPVLKLVAGRYKVMVSDKTAKAGFTVQWSDNAPIALTGRTFVGKRSVTLSFRVGEWAFYSPPGTRHAFSVVK